jgi:iron(III) transport system permease protein
MLPLAVPGLVMAAGYVAITLPNTPLAAIGPTRNPTVLLIIAYTIRRLPYMVRSVSAGLQQTSETLEEAAQNLGAPRWKAVLRITVPLVMANILAGAILSFSFNMLDVSDSLILAQTKEFYPITKQLYELVNIGTTTNMAAALGVYGMGLLTATLIAANVLLGRKMEFERRGFGCGC